MSYVITSVIETIERHPELRYPYRNPEGVVCCMVHHAAGNMTLETLAKVHIQADASRGKGEWPGAAYDYWIPIHPKDAIYQLHEIWEKGYHCRGGGMNTKALSICLEGNFEIGKPTDAQLKRLVWLIQHTNERDGLERLIVWHQDYQPTLCPGRNMPRAEIIRRVAEAYDPDPEPNPTPEPDPEPSPPPKDPPRRMPERPLPDSGLEQRGSCIMTAAFILLIITTALLAIET